MCFNRKKPKLRPCLIKSQMLYRVQITKIVSSLLISLLSSDIFSMQASISAWKRVKSFKKKVCTAHFKTFQDLCYHVKTTTPHFNIVTYLFMNFRLRLIYDITINTTIFLINLHQRRETSSQPWRRKPSPHEAQATLPCFSQQCTCYACLWIKNWLLGKKLRLTFEGGPWTASAWPQIWRCWMKWMPA